MRGYRLNLVRDLGLCVVSSLAIISPSKREFVVSLILSKHSQERRQLSAHQRNDIDVVLLVGQKLPRTVCLQRCYLSYVLCVCVVCVQVPVTLRQLVGL